MTPTLLTKRLPPTRLYPKFDHPNNEFADAKHKHVSGNAINALRLIIEAEICNSFRFTQLQNTICGSPGEIEKVFSYLFGTAPR